MTLSWHLPIDGCASQHCYILLLRITFIIFVSCVEDGFTVSVIKLVHVFDLLQFSVDYAVFEVQAGDDCHNVPQHCLQSSFSKSRFAACTLSLLN